MLEDDSPGEFVTGRQLDEREQDRVVGSLGVVASLRRLPDLLEVLPMSAVGLLERRSGLVGAMPEPVLPPATLARPSLEELLRHTSREFLSLALMLVLGCLVATLVQLETCWAQQYDQDGNPKGPKIEDQASADAVPRNVTIGFYGPLSIREGTDPAWIEAAEQAYRSDEAAARQQQAIPLADAEDYGDEFAAEEVPF